MKTDRSIITTNDQQFGDVADPNKLETQIEHVYDVVDENDNEFIAHQKEVDPTSTNTTRDKHVSNNDIKNVHDRLDGHDTDILNLENQDISLQNQIDSNDTDISSLETRATNLENNKTNVTGDHKGTWQGLTPGEASEAINGARIDQAKIDTDGVVRDTLKERLDYEHEEVSTKLAEITTNINYLPSFERLPLEVTDNARIQRAIDDLVSKGGGILVIPKKIYDFDTTTIILKSGIKVMAYGAVFRNTTDHFTFINMENDSSIYGLEIVGAGNSVLNYNGKAIDVSGADANNYKNNITLIDCYFHNLGGYGVYLEFAESIEIHNIKIEHVGYAGIHGFSVNDVTVMNPKIKDVNPGTGTTCYGITFSRRGDSSDLTIYPRSKDCEVIGGKIEDIPVWVGLDTHGGENISFKETIIRNCKMGVGIVSSHLNGVDDRAPIFCSVENIKMFGIGTNVGVVVAGAGTSSSVVEYAVGCSISGCNIDSYGEQTNSISGAIQLMRTIGVRVSNNTLNKSFANGICVYTDNIGFNVTDNIIVDVQDSTYVNPSGVSVRDADNNGLIDGNIIVLKDTTINTNVSVLGIAVLSSTNIDVTIGKNYNTFTTPLYGARGQKVSYGTIADGNVKIMGGINSPEGVITANVGSLYIQTNGGAGTTFYVKESGTGNTGWVAK